MIGIIEVPIPKDCYHCPVMDDCWWGYINKVRFGEKCPMNKVEEKDLEAFLNDQQCRQEDNASTV